MAIHTLVIPDFLPPTVNALMFAPVHRRIRLTKQCKEFVAVYAMQQGIPKATGKRRVRLKLFLGPRNRTRDKDSSHKALLDALKTSGLIRDDSPEWCECPPLEQVKADRPETQVILEDLPPQAEQA